MSSDDKIMFDILIVGCGGDVAEQARRTEALLSLFIWKQGWVIDAKERSKSYSEGFTIAYRKSI